MFVNIATSVSRFGKNSPLYQTFKSLCAILWIVYLICGKLLCQLWHFHAIGPIVNVVNGQRANNNTDIWSH